MRLFKQVLVVFTALGVLLAGLFIFTYDVIKVDWISFMEIQPSYKPMEHPLPVADRSIPIEGAAYIPGQGSPVNPIPADKVSVERGRILFTINCVQCHGPNGEGNGIIGGALVNQPANLTSDAVQSKADGALFLTISNGIKGAEGQIHMPALNENLTVRDRWDVVNFVRTLKATVTPTPQP